MLLKNCRFIITQDPSRRILENHDIHIVGSKIAAIGKDLKVRDAEVIDCSNKAVLPGLINTHGHHSMGLLRGICDDEELKDWLARVIPKEAAMTKEQFHLAARNAIEEMISSGTTTFVEMYGLIGPLFEETKKSGLRAVMMPVLSDKLGHMTADLKKVESIITKNIHGSPLITWSIAAHSIYACSEKLLNDIAHVANELNISKGMHIAETRQERFDCQRDKGCLPIEYLEKIGWLDSKTLLTHAVWLTKGEIKILKKYDVRISHCPISNMKLASGGVMPLPEMQQEGVIVGLGTDSVASNNNLDLFEEMKVTGLLHKHHRWDPTTAPVQMILDMATIDGAKCIGLDKEIGSIDRKST